MDGDLAIIFGFILAVIMLVLPFAYLINQRVQQHEERKLELKARAEEAKAANSIGGANYRKLEERVRVLERIATDGNHNLAIQIEQLRDLHEIEDQTAVSRERAQ